MFARHSLTIRALLFGAVLGIAQIAVRVHGQEIMAAPRPTPGTPHGHLPPAKLR